MCLTDSGDERAIRPDVEAIVEGKPLPSFDFREPDLVRERADELRRPAYV